MKTSEQINELAAALAKAQGEMGGAKKDAMNPFFKSKYADLASVVDALKGPFSANGLSYVQTTDFDESESVIVVTRLMHASGQWMESEGLRMRPVKADPQGIGSTITYARRYALQSMAGIAPEDDDGNAGSQPAKAKEAPPDESHTDALMALSDVFGKVYRQDPRVMPFGPSDRSEKATTARREMVAQVLGREVPDIRGLTTDSLLKAADELRNLYLNGAKK